MGSVYTSRYKYMSRMQEPKFKLNGMYPYSILYILQIHKRQNPKSIAHAPNRRKANTRLSIKQMQKKPK